LFWVAGCSEGVVPAGPGPGPDDPIDSGGLGPRDDAGARALDAGRERRDGEVIFPGGDIPLADPAPPPISGGSMAITADDLAVVGDPDLDRVFIASLERGEVLHDVALEPFDEPGRVAIDDRGRAHVVLRRGGGVATIDIASGAILARRMVCSAPRGIAWRTTDATLVVACADGTLAFLPDGAPMRTVFVEDDLRDVVVSGELLLVSRFRSAEILALDGAGSIVERSRPPNTIGGSTPGVAWRMIPHGSGAFLLYRAASTTVLMTTPASLAGVYYGSDGPSCGGTIAVTLVQLDGRGRPVRAPVSLARRGLVVDIAADPLARAVAIASPGDTETTAFVYRDLDFTGELDPCTGFAESSFYVPGRAESTVAIARSARYGFVAFARSPSRLTISAPAGRLPREIVLDETSREHLGHALFHQQTPSGIACASCHPEGGDDGHVWTFDIGARRTQSMRGGVSATAPFHWTGDMRSMEVLIEEVYVGRMTGRALSPEHKAAFVSWMDSVPPLSPPAIASDRVERGKAIFRSSELGCAVCHSGPHLTNGLSVDVGTNGVFQVPSLRGVGYRAPYMHDGCAATLRERFTDPTCGGGDRHGRTSELSPAQVDDLIAYLMSL
jgi:mono/diheme cytochrome c family protein